jgi:lipopolysaccharide/colanic/teichoic acid biosynthesis glycosyltransferase
MNAERHRADGAEPGASSGALGPRASTHRVDGRRILRRSCDVVVAATVLVCTTPVLLLAAIAIKLDSKGPVISRHRRVGKDGACFDLLRLRSTSTKGEKPTARRDEPGPGSAAEHGSSSDRDVTKVGRILRLASIDELPHFWNVLRGDMSLVGPRPARPPAPSGKSDDLPAELGGTVPGLSGVWREAERSKAS